MTNTIKIGVMPGRLNEFVLGAGTTYREALATAELVADGYEVKADGNTVTNLDSVIASGTNVVLLTKKVKGNNTLKIGVMPGRLNEFALPTDTTVADALAQAELSADGYEVKADGNVVSDLNQPIGSANVILLTKKVKGNNTLKIGVMPGRLNEFALPTETTVADALAQAELSADGYEVKADGNVVTDLNTPIGSANVILLTKKVKGNNTVKIGVMPGRLNEFALPTDTSVKDALAQAELSADGYEVKADGNVVTDFNQPIGSANVILLTKKVKGNNGGSPRTSDDGETTTITPGNK